ncbi:MULTISPECIES: LysR substrate-binding domain-containing protein [Pseudomonas]|jgi:DNA-binding transcriptional LysR family regulator|uniref:LysR family transcriptional regulator n=1 Tax=Pseudomonas orientalis TaxID=76758 RepID=A0A4Q7CTB4_9PSED|nr:MULTISPECIES: LysR substrate-binding domain-containing protein [Pseudomonas]MBY8931021.1 LysR family transcriptional regulator [Pseudomonas sp. Wu6]RZI29475.1 LysR family transcriptional regulator [Pseudomonas orientalis]CRM41205.1 Gcv operon activator [Pseudomonas sp. 44 R 15]CRM51115.1 Gcv operon activator [Pseudomonas sp. 24 E 13]
MNLLGKTLPPLASLLPFEAAARLESFSRAADELHITQAAVSRQIRGLEDNLGVKLFYRRNRAVFLTREGRELGRVVSLALQSISEGAASLRASPQRNRVVLLCQLCEAFYWLMPRLATFHQQYPQIEIQVVTCTRPITQFNDPFDVALQSTRRASGAHALMFTACDEVFPVCSPAYLCPEQPLALPELATCTFLHHSSEPPHLMEWDEWLKAFGQSLARDARGVTFDSYPLMLQAAVEGHGMAMGWRRTASRLIESGALIRPCAESVFLPEAISVYRQQGAGNRDEVVALLAWLEAQLQSDG